MNRLILILALCPVAMSAKRVITHETLWTMKRVGAPAPSPDGKWVVFPVTDPAYDEKDAVSDLWIAPTDASAKPRRLTFTKGGSIGASGPVIVDGMLYVNSGYGALAGIPGNVLLAFGLE